MKLKLPVVPTVVHKNKNIYSAIQSAKTQKASGIFYLMHKEDAVKSNFGWSVPKHIKFEAGTEFFEDSFNYPVFARPCPTIPRHGFVDSIICNNAVELNAVSNQTFDVESEAEILITKPVNASYNAILTDGVLTFAPGNDGATSGKGVKYFYILNDVIADTINLDKSLLLEGELPFYEFVFDKEENTTHLVQVRSAPGVPKSKNYIPTSMEVKEIIKAGGDLLEWESRLKKIDPSTTIIDHTDGSLASHYAIHAIVNKIPIFTTDLPSIGDYIEPTVATSEISSEQKNAFYKAFCAGFDSSSSVNFSNTNVFRYAEETISIALSCLHNYGASAMAGDYEVLGMCLGLFVRTTFAVSAGEARYAASRSLKNINDVQALATSKFVKKIPNSREAAYKYIYSMSTKDLLDIAPYIYYAFDKYAWGGGFGGSAWKSCTKSAMNLFNSCIDQKIESVVELFNNVIHEEHNNGRYLNKVITIGEFDSAAEDPSRFAMRNLHKIVTNMGNAWGKYNKNIMPVNLSKIVIDTSSIPMEAVINGPLVLTEEIMPDIFVNTGTSNVNFSLKYLHPAASKAISDKWPVSTSVGMITSMNVSPNHDEILIKYKDINYVSQELNIKYEDIASLPKVFITKALADCKCCYAYPIGEEIKIHDSKGWFVISYLNYNMKIFSKSALTKYINGLNTPKTGE
jgi:hypothetical protein